MSFYLSLFVFIISLVAGLVLMIMAKGMHREKFLLLSSIHGIFLLAFLASLILQRSESAYNYFFMMFICSGVVLSGLSWRSDSPQTLRIYFSVFALTFPIFLLSPSLLLNFLLTASFNKSTEQMLPLQGRYYLEKQNISRKKEDIEHYKLILKKGIFHQTVQRDLSFGGKLDSVKVIQFEPGEFIMIRGYTSQNTYVSTDKDSLDVQVPLASKKPGAIEYRL